MTINAEEPKPDAAGATLVYEASGEIVFARTAAADLASAVYPPADILAGQSPETLF